MTSGFSSDQHSNTKGRLPDTASITLQHEYGDRAKTVGTTPISLFVILRIRDFVSIRYSVIV